MAPTRLAQLVIATLVDEDGKRCFVRVDAERFWPTHLGWTRPSPRIVIDAVDDIAKCGVIHEALFPVLWQVGTAALPTDYLTAAMVWTTYSELN